MEFEEIFNILSKPGRHWSKADQEAVFDWVDQKMLDGLIKFVFNLTNDLEMAKDVVAEKIEDAFKYHHTYDPSRYHANGHGWKLFSVGAGFQSELDLPCNYYSEALERRFSYVTEALQREFNKLAVNLEKKVWLSDNSICGIETQSREWLIIDRKEHNAYRIVKECNKQGSAWLNIYRWCPFPNWLFVIIARGARRRAERERARRIKERMWQQQASVQPAERPHDWIKTAEGERRIEILRQMARKNPKRYEKYLRAIELCILQDLPIKEAAEIAGIKPNTMKQHVRRARLELRRIREQLRAGGAAN